MAGAGGAGRGRVDAVGVPVRRDGARRREAILDAALRCFAERGVLATGVEDVRRAAGASPSSMYHFFDGLSGLTQALLARTFDRLFAHVASRVVPTGDAEGAVVALVDGHLEWVFAHRDEGRFLYQATALEFDPAAVAALQARKAAALAPVVAHLGRFLEEGSLPRWPVIALDVVLLGPSHEACRRWLAGAPLDPAWLRATLPGLAWRSVAPAPATGPAAAGAGSGGALSVGRGRRGRGRHGASGSSPAAGRVGETPVGRPSK
jgi:AcrR family transcriptional regulator